MENKANTLNFDFLFQLRCLDRKLTSTQKRLQTYLLDHAADVGYLSLKELSENAHVSEVSVLNFCRLLGFANYIDMREQFRNHTRAMMRNLFIEPRPASSAPRKAEDIFRYCAVIAENHNQMLREMQLDQLAQCAELQAHSSSILVFGHDMSKIAADYLTSRFTYLHITSRSVNLGDNDTVQMLLAGLQPSDSVIIFSFPPYYMPAGDVAAYVRHCGSSLITIANGEDSPVVAEGGINFLCRAQNPYFFNSMSVPLHFSEILAYAVAAAMGRKSEDIVNGINAVEDYFLHNKR